MPHAIGRLDVAGRDLTLHLATLLRESGVVMNSSAEMEIVRWARGGGSKNKRVQYAAVAHEVDSSGHTYCVLQLVVW